MTAEAFSVARRFCGPPQSGNGGYVCGRLGKHLLGSVAVRLRVPPPLDVELQVEASATEARLLKGSTVVAEARQAPLQIQVPAAPSFAEAAEASKGYVGFIRHSFPGCFVCGPERGEGDGLRIFPGAAAGRALVAAPWVPDSSLAEGSPTIMPEYMWAALDCPSGFAVMPLPEGKTILLGELCVQIEGTVPPGSRCVVVGWSLGVEGRKHFGCSAVFAEDRGPVAVGRATWIEVPIGALGSQPPQPQ